METLKTATQKEFHCDYFNPFPPAGQINLRVLNSDLLTVATVFSDPVETAELHCGSQVALQYTKLMALIPEGDAIRVVLGKE